jgi:hypothetical protein
MFYPQTFVVAGSVRYSAAVQPNQTENSVSDLLLQTQADTGNNDNNSIIFNGIFLLFMY